MSASGATEHRRLRRPARRTGRRGRKLLRLEVRNAQTPIERKPEWIARRRRWGPSTRPCSRS
jgi:hypothetical protein